MKLRLLFEMDMNDYAGCTHTFVRNSARSIIIRDRKAAMIHSMKYDYYKFPGGGIEKGEDPIAAMIRETREEAGLEVIPESVREYGNTDMSTAFREATGIKRNALFRITIIIFARQTARLFYRAWMTMRPMRRTRWNTLILKRS